MAHECDQMTCRIEFWTCTSSQIHEPPSHPIHHNGTNQWLKLVQNFSIPSIQFKNRSRWQLDVNPRKRHTRRRKKMHRTALELYRRRKTPKKICSAKPSQATKVRYQSLASAHLKAPMQPLKGLTLWVTQDMIFSNRTIAARADNKGSLAIQTCL